MSIDESTWSVHWHGTVVVAQLSTAVIVTCAVTGLDRSTKSGPVAAAARGADGGRNAGRSRARRTAPFGWRGQPGSPQPVPPPPPVAPALPPPVPVPPAVPGLSAPAAPPSPVTPAVPVMPGCRLV